MLTGDAEKMMHQLEAVLGPDWGGSDSQQASGLGSHPGR